MAESTEQSPAAQFLPAAVREGRALCLSGGGYRAALFHLGALRRFNELGLLAQVDTFSSVSGGSILAAHLARQFVEHGAASLSDYERFVAEPFRRFVKNDIRTTPALTRLLPWEWAHGGAGAEALEAKYRELLVGDLALGQLPDRPRFVFCATDLPFGVSWIFSKERVGDYQAGYLDAAQRAQVPLAKAVAASSCFPPVFKPLPMSLNPADLAGGDAPPGDDRDSYIQAMALSDGGVYDNMGLEPVWKNHMTVLVCDGGKPFTFAKESDTPQQLYRIHDVMANQAEALRKRWLIASFLTGVYDGAYLGIRNSVEDFPSKAGPGYSKQLAVNVIAKIRTDMDRFSDDEIAVLENHGYLLADAAYRSHIHKSDEPVPAIAPLHNQWWPGNAATLPALEQHLTTALADSSHVKPLGH